MTEALRVSESYHQHTEQLNFTELNDQHIELLPARTVLSMLTIQPGASGGDGTGSSNNGVRSPLTTLLSDKVAEFIKDIHFPP